MIISGDGMVDGILLNTSQRERYIGNFVKAIGGAILATVTGYFHFIENGQQLYAEIIGTVGIIIILAATGYIVSFARKNPPSIKATL